MDQKIYITQHQLQRMLFFAHGCHLARYNQPLIDEQFEAWKLGPVVPHLFRIFIFYGNRKIFNAGLLQVPPHADTDKTLDTTANNVIHYTLQVVASLSDFEWHQWTEAVIPKWAKSTDTRGLNLFISDGEIEKHFRGLPMALETSE